MSYFERFPIKNVANIRRPMSVINAAQESRRVESQANYLGKGGMHPENDKHEYDVITYLV